MKLNEEGHDTYICQVCGRVRDGQTQPSAWRPDITGHQSAGNVCPECLRQHEIKVTPARWESGRSQHRGPVSLYDHCRRESGLTGAALDRYINRHYGHS